MGLSSDLKKVLRNVKKIPGLPNAIYKKLKDRLKRIEKKIGDLDMSALDPKKIAADVGKAISDTLGKHFEAIGKGFTDLEEGFTGHLNDLQAGFENALDNVKATVERIPATIKKQFDEIKDWTRGLVDEMMAMNPLSNIEGLWTKYLPWIIAIVAIILIPVLGPTIMTVLRFIF